MLQLIPLDRDKVKDLTYIKIVENKAHMGPVSEEKAARAKAAALCAAANKIRVLADFTVKISKDPSVNKSNRSNNRSFIIGGTGSSTTEVAQTATFMMQAWHNTLSDNSEGYKSKIADYLTAQSRAYSDLGITRKEGERPALTSDQRLVYNSIVGPTSFDYYEYHLAFKLQGNKKFYRSNTYRSLRPLVLGQLLNKVSNEMVKLQKSITITVRQSN